VESDASGAERFIFVEHTYAISDVAESFPSVCGHDWKCLRLFSRLYCGTDSLVNSW